MAKEFDNEELSRREELEKEIKWYCEEIDMPLPKGFPDKMSIDEMEDFIDNWSEYNEFPELD